MRDWHCRSELNFFGRLLIILLALSALSSVGCVKTIKSTPTILKTYDRAAARDLVEKINVLQKVQSLNANVSIRVIDLKLSEKGKIEPYRPADGLIVLQRPQHIRVLIRVPVIKQNIADMTSDGERFRIAIYYPDEYKQFLVGSNDRNYEEKMENWKDKDRETVGSLSKIRPQHITEALLINPVDVSSTEVQYFVADAQQEETVTDEKTLKKRQVLRTYEILFVLDKIENGELRLRRQFWFDRTDPSLPLARILIFNGNGALSSEISYKQHQQLEGGILWPKLVEVKRVQDSYALEINFDREVKYNSEIDKRAFVLENSQKLPERDLDGHQQPPRASPDR